MAEDATNGLEALRLRDFRDAADFKCIRMGAGEEEEEDGERDGDDAVVPAMTFPNNDDDDDGDKGCCVAACPAFVAV